MKAQFTALLASLAIVGCGGGSSAPAQDNTAALAQAAQNAAGNYAAQHPAPATAPYTGSFVTLSATGIAPTPQGFVSGASEKAVAMSLMNAIVAQPTVYADWYRALLSSDGITVKLMGDKVGTGIASGLPLYAPDTIFLATLRNDGLHVVQTN